MVVLFDFDGDSGIKDLEGNWMNETIWASNYLLIIGSEKHKHLFVENWYKRNFGISDKVYEVIEPIFEDIAYCLMNDIEETFVNGNYTVKLMDRVDFYYITRK